MGENKNMIFDISGKEKNIYSNLYGDGITDDSYALQHLIDSNSSIVIPNGLTVRLTRTININISKLKMFDGGNSVFLVDGSFPAFRVYGTNAGSADPSTQMNDVLEKEAGFIFKNAIIIGNNKYNAITFDNSTGIVVENCFGITITNCYITQVRDGIVVSGMNRNIIFSDNNIYNLTGCGIKYDNTVNLHQHNVVGNMIQYCKYCVMIDGSKQIANFQFTGNDIEISTYPNIDFLSQRCIYIDAGDTETGQLSEIVFSGNTIQGHSQSDCIIEVKGGSNRLVKFITFIGNHVSNTKKTLINLEKVINASITGNTFCTYNSNPGAYAVDLKNCNVVSVCSNSCHDMSYLVKTSNGTKSVSVVGNALYVFLNKALEETEAVDSIIEYGNAIAPYVVN